MQGGPTQPGDPTDGPPDQTQHLMRQALAAKRLWQAGRWAESLPFLVEIVRLDPDSPHAHRDLATALQRCGRLNDAWANLHRVRDLMGTRGAVLPHLDIAEAFADLARAFEADGHDQTAALVYRDASAASEKPAEADHFLAAALTLEGNLEDAEQASRRALAGAPGHAAARHLLGHVLSQRGRFDEAAEQLAQAIDLSPERPFAFETFTRARRMTAADRPLIERIRALTQRPDVDPSLSVALHFGLGKAFDDLGDYAAAITHFDAANRLKAATLRLDRARLSRTYDDLISFFTADRLDHAARTLGGAVGPPDPRPIFIVGMPRSGSTLLEQILSSHPAVAAGGEITFWTDRVASWQAAGPRPPDAAALAAAARDYRALLTRIAQDAARVTDKALTNAALLWVFRVALPDARIIHCTRDPVDTCLSIYFTNFRARHDYAYDRGDLVFYYRQHERLMAHWRRVLPPDRLTDVSYETLISDREAETRRLLAFCGLDWNDACLAPERNTRSVATASRWQVRQPVYATSIARWRRYEPWLGELRDLLPALSGRQ